MHFCRSLCWLLLSFTRVWEGSCCSRHTHVPGAFLPGTEGLFYVLGGGTLMIPIYVIAKALEQWRNKPWYYQACEVVATNSRLIIASKKTWAEIDSVYYFPRCKMVQSSLHTCAHRHTLWIRKLRYLCGKA